VSKKVTLRSHARTYQLDAVFLVDAGPEREADANAFS
jgi:hypothetical protein